MSLARAFATRDVFLSVNKSCYSLPSGKNCGMKLANKGARLELAINKCAGLLPWNKNRVKTDDDITVPRIIRTPLLPRPILKMKSHLESCRGNRLCWPYAGMTRLTIQQATKEI